MKWYEKELRKKPKFCSELTKQELLNFLLEEDYYSDYPFLLDKKEIDNLMEWTQTYLEDIEFIYQHFGGWIVKYSIQRQKRLNGGF